MSRGQQVSSDILEGGGVSENVQVGSLATVRYAFLSCLGQESVLECIDLVVTIRHAFLGYLCTGCRFSAAEHHQECTRGLSWKLR